MDLTEAIFGQNPLPPPAKLKVYAPNGDTKEIVAYLGVRTHKKYSQLVELFLQYVDGTIEVLNKKVVVQNLETGDVCYDPRTVPVGFGNGSFITGDEKIWLQKHLYWPAILELWDNPVNNGEEKEGLNL